MDALGIGEMLSGISGKMLDAIFFDYRFLPVYVIIALIIKAKHDRFMEFEAGIYGKLRKTGRRIIEEIALTGLTAGFFISFVVVGAGITIHRETFSYLFIIMVILAAVNTRYACISYAGGIFAVAASIFNLGKEADIPGILMLAAILHMLEGALVFLFAGKDAVPVFIKHEEGIAGAFLMQKFWAVPVVFATFAAQTIGTAAAGRGALNQWPQLEPGVIRDGAYALGLDCVIGVLAYSDIAISKTPEKRSRETAFMLICYSAVLLAISVASAHVPAFGLIGALFAVAAHETIILSGHYRERIGEPMFKAARRGIRVLDVLPEAHAFNMGIKRGDVILSINGKDVQTEKGIDEALKDFPVFVWVDVLDAGGNRKTYEYRRYPEGLNCLGIITVPREREVTYNIDRFGKLVILKNLVERFMNANRPA